MGADGILFSNNTMVTYDNKEYKYNKGQTVKKYDGNNDNLKNITAEIHKLMSKDGNNQDLTYEDLAYATFLEGKYGIKQVKRHASAGIVTFYMNNGKNLRFDFETKTEIEDQNYQNLQKKKEAYEEKLTKNFDKWEDDFDIRLIQSGDNFGYKITLKEGQSPLEIGKTLGWSAQYIYDNNDLYFHFFNETEMENLGVKNASSQPDLYKTIEKGHTFTVPADALNFPESFWESIFK